MESVRTLIDVEIARALALVALVCAVALVVATRHALAVRARARTLSTTRIDALKGGHLARITGRIVKGDDALTAPLSGRVVASYALELFATRAAASRPIEVTLVEEARHARLAISDQTGLVVVPLGQARVFYDEKDTLSGAYDGAPARVRDAIRAAHPEVDPRGLSYRERVLACGDLVTAIGTVTTRDRTKALRAGTLPLVVARGEARALTRGLVVRALATGLAALAFFALAFALFALARDGGAP